MSFSKANIKRFNENKGCAPPPGSYDPALKGKASGGAVDKSERFKAPKDFAPGPGSHNISSAAPGHTPVKQLFAVPAVQSGKKVKTVTTGTADHGKIKELEKDIRGLVKERSDQDKKLTHREEELRKLDGKLHNAQSDKSTLTAKLAATEKDLKDLKKSNDVLKTKVSTSESSTKKHDDIQTELSSLKHQLQQKDHEITRLKQEVDVAMTTIGTDIQMFETLTISLEDNVATYSKFVNSLGSKIQEKQTTDNAAKLSKEEDLSAKLKDEKMSMENKIKSIKKRVEVLQKRFSKAVGDLKSMSKLVEDQYTSIVQEHNQLQDSVVQMKTDLKNALDVRTALEEHRDSLLDNNTDLQDRVKQLTTENNTTGQNYRELVQNIEDLQAGKAALQLQLDELEKLHDTTQKQDADRIMALEEREMIINETTGNLHERIVALQAENEDLAATLRETGELLSRTNNENTKLEEMLVTAEGKWESEKKQYLIELEELVIEKSRAECRLCDYEEKVKVMNEDLVSQKAESDERIQELYTELEKEKLELTQLQAQLEDIVTNNIAALTDEVDGLKEQKDQMAKELDDWLTDKSELDIEIAKQQCTIKVLEMENKQTVEEKEEEIRQLRNEIERVKMEKEQIQKDMEQYGIDLLSNAAQLQSLRAELHSKCDDCVMVEGERDQLKGDLDQTRHEQDKLKADLVNAHSERDELKGDCVKIQEERNQLQGNLGQVQEERDQLRVDCVKVQAEKDHFQCNLNKVLGDFVKVQEEKDYIRGERDGAQEALEQTMDGIDRLVGEQVQLKGELDQFKGDLDTTRQEKDRVQGECDELKGYLDQTALERDEVQEILDETRVEKDRLEGERDELRGEVDQTRQEIDRVQESLEQVEEELTHQKEENEDLHCRLEQTREDFLKRCDERDELKQTNETKDKSLAVLAQQVADLNTQLDTANSSLQQKCKDCEEMSQKSEEHEKELTLSKQQSSNFRQQIEDYKEHLQLKCDECDDLQQKCDDLDQELTLGAKDVLDLHDTIASLQSERSGVQADKAILVETYETQMTELRTQVEGANKTSQLEAELQRIQQLYSELQAKVEPFMEQIDAFELEKQSLLGLNKHTQADLERLNNDYARLLGHQNQKQKIKHIMKIKEENNSLKQENFSLKDQVTKHKRQIQKLQEKDIPRRFDPTNAFKSSKENIGQQHTTKSPLKTVNRK